MTTNHDAVLLCLSAKKGVRSVKTIQLIYEITSKYEKAPKQALGSFGGIL
jgi:hypothetical protein